MVIKRIKKLFKKKDESKDAGSNISIKSASAKKTPTKKKAVKKTIKKIPTKKKAVAKKVTKKTVAKKKAAPKKKTVRKVTVKKKAVPKKKTIRKVSKKKTPAKKKATRKSSSKEYDNRFQKFYDLNKDRINKERRKKYKQNQKAGTCVRCKRKAVKGIKLCKYHREKQKEYNNNRI